MYTYISVVASVSPQFPPTKHLLCSSVSCLVCIEDVITLTFFFSISASSAKSFQTSPFYYLMKLFPLGIFVSAMTGSAPCRHSLYKKQRKRQQCHISGLAQPSAHKCKKRPKRLECLFFILLRRHDYEIFL